MKSKSASQQSFTKKTVRPAWQTLFNKVAKYVLLMIFFVLSLGVQLAILLLPFRVICRYLGTRLDDIDAEGQTTKIQEQRAHAIGRVCERATQYLPLKSKCLVQALLTKNVLSLLNIPCVVHIGVSRSDDNSAGFKAHAWTSVGRNIVTGRKVSKRYTTISRFANSRFSSAL